MSIKVILLNVIRKIGTKKVNIYDVIKRVRHIKYASEGTVLRKLRELRQNGLVFYDVVDKRRGIYEIKLIRG